MNSTAEPSINAEFIDSARSSFTGVPRNYNGVFEKGNKRVEKEESTKRNRRRGGGGGKSFQTVPSYTRKHTFLRILYDTSNSAGRNGGKRIARVERSWFSTNNDIIRKKWSSLLARHFQPRDPRNIAGFCFHQIFPPFSPLSFFFFLIRIHYRARVGKFLQKKKGKKRHSN